MAIILYHDSIFAPEYYLNKVQGDRKNPKVCKHSLILRTQTYIQNLLYNCVPEKFQLVQNN